MKLLAYSHPRIQTVMLGSVVFLTVGMYHVITSLGGAGQQTATLADTANITLYAVFMVFCLATPACLNYFGLRASLCFGSIGYAAYAASLWCYNRTGNQPFVIFGGAWCGLSAAFLWTAERTGVVAYAPEGKKGLYVSIFWTVYQIGTVVGFAIPVAQNWKATAATHVNDGTYIGLFVLMLCGSIVALLLLPTNKVVREDGMPVTMPSQMSIKQHVVLCWRITVEKKWIILMWPLAFGTNYYVIYQSNRYNGVTFSVRGRALNTLSSGLAQVASTWTMTALMDWVPLRRVQRAYLGVAFNLLLTTGVWIGGYYAMEAGLPNGVVFDVFDSGLGVRAFLYAMYGYMDGCYNTFALWFIGYLSNDFEEVSLACRRPHFLSPLGQSANITFP